MLSNKTERHFFPVGSSASRVVTINKLENEATTTAVDHKILWEGQTTDFYNIVALTGDITILQSGLYYIGLEVAWDGNATGVRSQYFSIDGVKYGLTTTLGSAEATFSQIVTSNCVVHIEKDQVLTANVLQNSGVALEILGQTDPSAYFTRFFIVQL